MSLSSYKITDTAIAQKGVVAAPDKLTGSAAQNKAVFDRLIREAVKGLFNGLIDDLADTTGAGEIGTAAITGVTGSDVQTVLGSLKTILDTKSASADVTAALALKSDKSVTDLHVKSVSFNANTGVFTFTREDGSYTTIDTALEKVATNWQYDADTQSLVLTLADGSTQTVPLSAFITETEFTDSDQIDFSVNNHTVTATIKAGSITDTMLASALVTQLQGYVTAASGSAGDALQYKNAAEGFKDTASQKATEAAGSATTAESWATGGSSGTPSATNNAKYYSEQASGSATTASTKASEASGSASAASGSATTAGQKATLAESYAKGGTGTRTGEDTDNAKYYMEQAAAIVGADYVTRQQIATIETTSTASQAHAIGEYFGYNGEFYRATAAISQGDTITPNTNCTQVKLADEVAGKQSKLTFDATPTASSTNPVTSGGVKTYVDGSYTIAGQRANATLGTKATAEGNNTIAQGNYSHAEGMGSVANGSASHAEGKSTYATGNNSHAEGQGTDARRAAQHVFGTYNLPESGSASSKGNYVEIVGNGQSDLSPSNARTLDWDGNEILAGKLTVGAAPTADMDAATKKYVDDGLSGKQATLTFDAAPTQNSTNPVTSGGVYTAIQSAGKSPYVHTFAANDWTVGSTESTLTIAAATHGLTGNAVLAQFWHQVNGVYQFNTWACIESWAEIDASTHVITLHGPTTAYAGKVVLFG